MSIKNILEKLNKISCPLIIRIDFYRINTEARALMTIYLNDIRNIILISEYKNKITINERLHPFLIEHDIKENDLVKILRDIPAELSNIPVDELKKIYKTFLAKDKNNIYYKIIKTTNQDEEINCTDKAKLFFNGINSDLEIYDNTK